MSEELQAVVGSSTTVLTNAQAALFAAVQAAGLPQYPAANPLGIADDFYRWLELKDIVDE